MEALEKKLAMSRSIMRKLYHKNVELEKEIQIMQVSCMACAYMQESIL